MSTADFTISFTTDKTPEEVFTAINNVKAWWCEDFTGESAKPGDIFDVQFYGIHFSTHEILEITPNKTVVWGVTKSKLVFLQDVEEWTGTTIHFDIEEVGGKTQLTFTHKGITPQVECYSACSNGWTQFVGSSLQRLINTGKGNPRILDKNVEENPLIK